MLSIKSYEWRVVGVAEPVCVNRHTQPSSGTSLKVHHHRKHLPMVAHQEDVEPRVIGRGLKKMRFIGALFNTIALHRAGKYV